LPAGRRLPLGPQLRLGKEPRQFPVRLNLLGAVTQCLELVTNVDDLAEVGGVQQIEE
jgi:hypothetical protein